METRAGVHEWDRERERLGSVLPAYEIGAIVGRGSFAVVYAARHRGLDRQVAIKRLSPELLQSSDARERFAAEARVLASLDHPHIVRVYDYVEDEDLCAFVMERMPGGTLAHRLLTGKPTRDWSCAVMLGALHGLEYAHRQGVLHRDVKPENLLFGDGELVKVADFGIAKVVGAQGARMTATAAGLGTPAYMAPEQVTREVGPLSSATDVWAAGAVLYELLAGQPPFGTEGDLGAVLLQRVSEDAPRLRDTASGVPDALDDVVMRALARNPAERYPTPGAFATDLEHVAGDLEATGVPIHRTAPAKGTPTEPVLLQTAPPAARRAPRRLALAAGVAAGLVAAVAAVVILATGGSEPRSAGAPGRVTHALPRAPAGWPSTVTSGYIDQVDGAPGVARRLGRGATTFALYGGDPAARTDWSHDKGQPPPEAFVRDVSSLGLFPYISFNVLRSLGQSAKGGDADAVALRKTLVDRRLMRLYWANVRSFLRGLGSAKTSVAVSLDSNFWSYVEQNLNNLGARPASVRALVGSSGLPELGGLPDDLTAFAAGWRTLRNRYAPKVMLGYAFDDWASGTDISRDSPARATAVAAGRQAGEFFTTVAANDMDFAALTIDGDGTEAGQNPSPSYVYSDREKAAVVTFLGEFTRVADVPVVLEGVPLGNTVSKAITDKPFHWHDTWVQWLVGDRRFTGLRRLYGAGVIGLMFGVSYGTGETCPCDAAHDGRTGGTSSDDDGGYFAGRMAALRHTGGLSLR